MAIQLYNNDLYVPNMRINLLPEGDTKINALMRNSFKCVPALDTAKFNGGFWIRSGTILAIECIMNVVEEKNYIILNFFNNILYKKKTALTKDVLIFPSYVPTCTRIFDYQFYNSENY